MHKFKQSDLRRKERLEVLKMISWGLAWVVIGIGVFYIILNIELAMLGKGII